MELAKFINPSGLRPMGKNLYSVTAASGDAITGVPGEDGLGTIAQGFLEMSNVSVVEEMVNMIAAQRAYEIGLVNRVFPPDQLLDEARKFAIKLAGMPSHALKLLKTATNSGYDLTLDSGLVLETQCFAHCWSHADLEEGTGAFVEKRKASFHAD